MTTAWVRRLSVRLWLTSVAAFSVTLCLLAAGSIYVLDQYPEQTLGRKEQSKKIRQIEEAMALDSNGCIVSLAAEQFKWFYDVLRTEAMYRVLDESGEVIHASDNALGGGAWLTGAPSAVAGTQQAATLDGRPFEVVTHRLAPGACQYYVQVAFSRLIVRATVRSKISQIPVTVGAAVFTAIVVFGLTLTVTLKRQLRPLRQASAEASNLTTRNLSARISMRDVPTELEPLIQSFNEALGRLEHGFVVQQQFLASAAHELQTPLTLLRGQLELHPRLADNEQVFRDIDLMARQVRQLLHLAEVSEAQNFAYAEIDPADSAREVVRYMASKANEKRVTLDIDVRARASTVEADASALFILLKNLVENAIHASPSHGIVLLAVSASSIHVIDEGPGIPDEHLPLLFARFWRAPGTEYDGAGLGLAICKEIATAHGWHLSVSRLKPGTDFAVHFSPAQERRPERDAPLAANM
ncbi:HAMP domain-containing sensor histidine kinase [Trinickia caryophylli]|uniref:histidine kinase n=1 Tax=Trinickia caryophylli TaxID=28094 RepID=A0A1X7H3Q3_TRICW|nr:HAMP domain-containing sensor histidine kinase [Trinickia caryophylli]PMS08842.1 sensor histidine kinase [Trinickia caryophylli]TRX17334.1 HAMP domain-containing histidine kinase [Trinickia caryophylli]WQE11927.1 HAMP domain-containing sensor histidine kinase [Trinickia caryophylli]SMF79259.1 Signal transduction histidine kinase [Trinickia caryophylli]GLU35684.1 histidine kinase [Trinickia caryophylli]